MSIIVEEITKLYGEQKALNNVSFQINSGEIVGFIGPNGAGKSTMMKIITGYLPQTQGKVQINGFDTQEESMNIKKLIGYLPEHNPLYIDMYVKEYLKHVAGLYKLGKNTKNRIEEVIKLTGLEREQHKKISALSKGYRQRVGLAQALIHDPQILILDEPTTGLDPNQIVEIRNLISSLGKEKTVMLSTHLMQEVDAICDRVIIINKGEIVANDSSENIQKDVNTTNQTIMIEFDSEIDIDKIHEKEFVKSVIHVKNNTWLIESNTNEDIRSQLFNMAVAYKWTILSIQLKEKSLEEVFQELTKGN